MRIAVVGLLMLGLVINASACSDEAPPVAESGGSSSGGSSGNGSSGNVADAGSLVDAPTSRPDPKRLCDPLAQRGQDVEVTVYSGAPPPAIGGTISPGTYDLILLERYTGSPGGPPREEPDGGEPPPPTSDPGAGRATIYVLGNALRFVESWGTYGSLPPDSTRGVSYVAKGTALETIEECPSAGKTKSIQYTVQGNSIALFTDNYRQVYQRSLEQGAE